MASSITSSVAYSNKSSSTTSYRHQAPAHTVAPKKPEPNQSVSVAHMYNAYHKGLISTSSHGDTVQISEEAKKKSAQAGGLGAIISGIGHAVQTANRDIVQAANHTAAGQFVLGAVSSTAENMSAGLLQPHTPDNPTVAYEVGRAVGDVSSTIAGALGTATGGAMIVGGGTLALATSPTGGGILAGAAVASEGITLTAGGATVVGKSIQNFGKDMHQLAQMNGSHSAETTGTGKASSVKSNLDQAESAGGHTIIHHVGKSDQELIDRANNDPKVSAASSFPNKQTAQKVVDSTIKSHQKNVDNFIQNARPGATKAFEYKGDGTVIGKSVQKGSTTVAPVTNARVVLKKDVNGGIVYTGYPRK